MRTGSSSPGIARISAGRRVRRPGSKGVLANVPLHAGLICIDGPTGMDSDLQRLLFEFALEELDEQPDLTNQVLEVTIDESGESLDLVRYEFPDR